MTTTPRRTRIADSVKDHARSTVPGIKKSVKTWRWQRLGILAFIFWVPVTIFAVIADEVIEQEPIQADIVILQSFRQLSNPTLDAVVGSLTDLGGTIGVITLFIGLLTLLIINRRYRGVVFAVAAVGGTVAINLFLKLFFQRERPSLWQTIVTENTFSFPSGHAMASCALAVTVVVLAWRYNYYKWPVTIIAAIYAVFIGLSRNYLGVHYPTDVAGGWAIALAWLIVVYVALYTPRLRVEKKYLSDKE